MKKIISFFVILMLVLVGCNNSENQNKSVNNVEYQNQPVVLTIESHGDFDYDLSNPTEIYKEADAIVVATINSIDGVDNFNKSIQDYVMTYTFGKAKTMKVLKGDVPQHFDFLRNGGVIEYDKYYNAQLDKVKNSLDNAQEKPDYVHEKFAGDIEIEENTTYVLYLVKDSDSCDEFDYCVIGFQGGLRKTQGNPNAKTSVQVYNNFNDEWEDLDTILP